MKKNYMIYGIAALTCLLAAACAKVETAEPAQEEETLTENVVVFKATASEDDTKAEITLADGDFFWTATSDKIAVATDEGYKISTGATGVSGNKADFSVDLEGANLNTDAFALYPHTLVWNESASAAREDCNPSHDGDGDNLVVYLPDSYPIGDVTSPKVPCPMIAKIVDNAGELGELSFKQLCAVLCIKVNSIPASAKTLVLDFNDKKVSGKFEIDGTVVPGTSSIVAADGSDDTITITGLSLAGWTDGLVINIPVPTGVADSNEFTNLTVTAKNSSNETVLEMTRPIKVGADWVPQRAMRRKIVASLPAFSVSDDVRVHIAKSNLQLTRPNTDKTWAEYQALEQLTWSFMDYPWSVETEKDMAVDYANKTAVRCFSWGTSGHNYNAGIVNPENYIYGQYYQPWNTADGETRQGSDFGPKGTAVGLTGTFTYGDWGRKICGEDKTALDDHSGYGASKDWRLFTRDEVLYLFGKTEDATFDNGANYITTGDATEGTIYTRRHNSWSVYKINTDTNPAYGLILVPDYFVDPTGVFVECSRYGYGNYGNSFTAAQWSLMEEAGAAFLPVSVRVLRNSKGGLAPDTNFSYWTSTVRTDLATHAWALQFTGSQNNWRVLPTDKGVNRRNGLPVRLIRDIE